MLKPVDHYVYLQFNGDGIGFTGNDGCNDIEGQLTISDNIIKAHSIQAPNKQSCLQGKKLEIARKVIGYLKNNSTFYIKENYLVFRQEDQAVMVFAKLNGSNSEETITKKSYRVYYQHVVQGKKKLMKLYDYSTHKNILISKINGFTFTPGYTYEIQMKSTIQGNSMGKTISSKYDLIKIVKKEKGNLNF